MRLGMLNSEAPPTLLARADEVIERSAAISSRCSAARRLRGSARAAVRSRAGQKAFHWPSPYNGLPLPKK